MHRNGLALTLAFILTFPFVLLIILTAGDTIGREEEQVFALQAEGPLAAETEAAVRAYLEAAAPEVRLAVNEPGRRPDLTLAAAPPEGAPAVPVVRRYWVPAVPFTSRVDGVSAEDVRRVLRGEVTDWSALGGDPGPVTVVLPVGEAAGVAAAAGVPEAALAAAPHVRWVPAEGLRAAVAGDPAAFALVPLDRLDFHLHSLAVDGIDVVRGTGEVAAYPLAERLWLVPAEGSRTAAGAAEQAAAALQVRLPEAIRVFMLGTTIPSRCSLTRAEATGDVTSSWSAAQEFLLQADYTVLNLESPVSDLATPPRCRESFLFGAPTAVLPGFTRAGVDLVGLANNHFLDYGWEVAADAIRSIQAAGIATVGAGPDLASARRPHVAVIKGVRFAFLAYDNVEPGDHAAPETPGVAPLDLATLAEDVAAARAQADVVVVMIQWIPEYQVDPEPAQQEAARAAVAAGADLVFGDGPHVVQAVQFFPDAYVDYSLGNWIFDQDWSAATMEGVVQEAVWHGDRLVQVTLYPYVIADQHQPQLLPRGEGRGRAILQRIYEATARLPQAR
ncbi:MAG TPA: CapA family protein [Dehalococcoidia bacterium]